MSRNDVTSLPDDSPEKLKCLIAELEKALAQKEQDIERQRECSEIESEFHRQALGAYETRLLSIKNTLAFQLGDMLVKGFKSWKSMKALPHNLRRLRKEARLRRALPSDYGIPAVTDDDFSPLLKAFERGGLDQVQSQLSAAGTDETIKAGIYVRLSDHLKSRNIIEAAKCARCAYEAKPSAASGRWLALRLLDCGEISESVRMFDRLKRETDLSLTEITRAETGRALFRMAERKPTLERHSNPRYTPAPNSMLYVAASCRPYHLTGYTMRTHELVRAIANLGTEVTVMTRPGYPWDRHDSKSTPASTEGAHDGIQYVHSRHPLKSLPIDLYVHYAASAIAKVAQDKKVALIHAASDHVNAMPALIAARRLGIPFHYEMRGLWMLSRASKIPGFDETEEFALSLDAEGFVASNADRLFVISDHLGAYIREVWPLEDVQIDLLPNGINADLLAAQSSPAPDRFTIAYAGALVPYEGLDLLIDAIKLLSTQGKMVDLVLMGDGENRDKLERQARQKGLSKQVSLLGKLQPDDARHRLGSASLICLPRRPDRVCEIIPPLKLTEAMALGLPVLVPDLPVFRSEVIEGETGYFFKPNDVEDLAATIAQCMEVPEDLKKVGSNARHAVSLSREWGSIVKALHL